jgi:hypothetical protein
VGPMVVNRAKILAPVDTGRLRASIGPAQYSRTWTLRPQVTVTAGVDYAKMVHDGTRAHWIRPQPGRQGKPKRGGGRKPTYLRFEVGGRVVYARETRPGPGRAGGHRRQGLHRDRPLDSRVWTTP